MIYLICFIIWKNFIDGYLSDLFEHLGKNVTYLEK